MAEQPLRPGELAYSPGYESAALRIIAGPIVRRRETGYTVLGPTDSGGPGQYSRFVPARQLKRAPLDWAPCVAGQHRYVYDSVRNVHRREFRPNQ